MLWQIEGCFRLQNLNISSQFKPFLNWSFYTDDLYVSALTPYWRRKYASLSTPEQPSNEKVTGSEVNNQNDWDTAGQTPCVFSLLSNTLSWRRIMHVPTQMFPTLGAHSNEWWGWWEEKQNHQSWSLRLRRLNLEGNSKSKHWWTRKS